MTSPTKQHLQVLRPDRARTQAANPLDALLRRGVEQEQDPAVRRWLERMLASEERGGEGLGREAARRARGNAGVIHAERN